MDHPHRYLSLHTVTMLREVIRKWWQVELGITDPSGRNLEPAWGSQPAPVCDFCRALLSCPEGRRRCFKSIRELHSRLHGHGRGQGSLAHTCHLGLAMAGCRVQGEAAQRGTFFACGFSSRELSRSRITRIRAALHEILPREITPDGDRVPLLGREDLERLKDLLEVGVFEMAAFERELKRRERTVPDQLNLQFEGIVARSPGMRRAVAEMRTLAQLSVPLLLVGEAGTGKRALARAIHSESPRKTGPFVVFEVCADPVAAETALFGQGRPDALGRAGVLEGADGGTLYLSAGSWQAVSIQIKLLRFLQEGTLVPLGSRRVVQVEVRLVLGLEGDPELEVAEGSLRRDLLEAIGEQRIRVPPLRDRLEDLPELVDLLQKRHLPESRPHPAVGPEVLSMFRRYAWPGNVAELEEEVRRVLSFPLRDGQLLPEAVSLRLRQAAGFGAPAAGLRGSANLRQAVEALERELIHQGLVRTRFNKSLLARQLGISRTNLLTKLQRYGLDQPGPLEE
jgi:DNA-binding NtrC family response regulator